MARLEFKATKDKFVHAVTGVTEISCAEVGFLAYAFQAVAAKDYDGAPDAYGHDRPGDALQTGLKPREKHLANATHPWQSFPKGAFEWVGVLSATKAYALANKLKIDDRYCATLTHVDKKGHFDATSLNLGPVDAKLGAYPVVQTTGDTKGYYVPHTNRVKSGSAWDVSIYANPLTLPMTVRTGAWKSKRTFIGDFGFAVNPSGAAAMGFVFGDSNGSMNVGEGSACLLNGIGSPSKAIYFGFPMSGMAGANGKHHDSLLGVTNGTVDAGVKTQMAKLKDVDNRMDLVDFIVAGADFNRFEARRHGVMPSTPQERKAEGAGSAAKLFGPLSGVGFPLPISDFSKFGFSGFGAAAG